MTAITCSECHKCKLNVHAAKTELTRLARMCARQTNKRNLALVAEAKSLLQRQRRFADDHQRMEHGEAA